LYKYNIHSKVGQTRMEFKTYKNTQSLHQLAHDVMLNMMTETIPFGMQHVKVLKVYDGDTMWVCSEINSDIRFKIRFDKINAPEIRKSTPEVKKKALESKQFVNQLLENEIVLVNLTRFGSFDRYIGTIYPTKEQWLKVISESDYMRFIGKANKMEGNMELNDYMILGGYAIKYKK